MRTTKIICLLALCLIAFNKTEAQSEATFYTSMGSFKIDLTDTLTPVTVDSFIARVSEKFYDGLTFHRVIDNFMIQGGDPSGNGTGGPGYTIPDEFHPTLKNVPKALAMANAGPNTGGCQFYINLVTNSHLNNKHTVFGMVTTNFTVVQNIGKVATDVNDKPLTPVIIDSIRITRFPVSVGKLNKDLSINIYPNPGGKIFQVDLKGATAELQILNMSGQIVFSRKVKDRSEVDLSAEPAGVYIVHITDGSNTAERKIIVR